MVKAKKHSMIGFHPSESVNQAIEGYSEVTGLSKSDIVRIAIARFFGIGTIGGSAGDLPKPIASNCNGH